MNGPNLPTVPIKTIEQQNLQALHRVRERLVKHRTAVVNQVRGLLLEYGIVIPQGIARLRKRLPRVLEEADNGLSFLMRDLLQSLQSELSALGYPDYRRHGPARAPQPRDGSVSTPAGDGGDWAPECDSPRRGAGEWS